MTNDDRQIIERLSHGLCQSPASLPTIFEGMKWYAGHDFTGLTLPGLAAAWNGDNDAPWDDVRFTTGELLVFYTLEQQPVANDIILQWAVTVLLHAEAARRGHCDLDLAIYGIVEMLGIINEQLNQVEGDYVMLELIRAMVRP